MFVFLLLSIVTCRVQSYNIGTSWHITHAFAAIEEENKGVISWGKTGHGGSGSSEVS